MGYWGTGSVCVVFAYEWEVWEDGIDKKVCCAC
jgi:hypothetical protein